MSAKDLKIARMSVYECCRLKSGHNELDRFIISYLNEEVSDMSEQQKRYNLKYKKETVKYIQLRIQQHLKPITAIAEELNIPVGTLNNWMVKFRQFPNEPFVGSGNIWEQDKRVMQLEQHVQDLEDELTILKKAVHIFSKDPK
jgi:transposase